MLRCFNRLQPGSVVVALSIGALYAASIGFSILHATGFTGGTLKNGSGCTCHGLVPSDSVYVWITGPDSLRRGAIATYTLKMAGGPAIKGGFNAAAAFGGLTASDTTGQLIGDELTQTVPKAFQNDTVEWRFRYQAPWIGDTDTLYGVGNSANGNRNPNGDQFNFSQNFVIQLKDTLVSVKEKDGFNGFALTQNYPNPFNPKTVIGYEIRDAGYVSLVVFDATGRKVASLVTGNKTPGSYSVAWDASEFPSGIYFYRMQAGEFTEVKKLVLVR